MNESPKENSSADTNFNNKKVKSELFHIWKKARVMYDMIKDDQELETWQKNNIRQAHDLLNETATYTEYQKIFPAEKEVDSDENKNNFLSNQDKRYPVPVEQENGDQFITRCILDANMKNRYPVQSDRFQACMNIFNEQKQIPHSNPGEKFEDPLNKKQEDNIDPTKPLLP